MLSIENLLPPPTTYYYHHFFFHGRGIKGVASTFKIKENRPRPSVRRSSKTQQSLPSKEKNGGSKLRKHENGQKILICFCVVEFLTIKIDTLH